MALVTKERSPAEAASWTKALVFGLPKEYGSKRTTQAVRWQKYKEEITLNNLTTAVLQAAMVRTYFARFHDSSS